MPTPSRRDVLHSTLLGPALLSLPPLLLSGCSERAVLLTDNTRRIVLPNGLAFRSVVTIENDDRSVTVGTLWSRWYHLRLREGAFSQPVHGSYVVTADMRDAVRHEYPDRLHILSGDMLFLVNDRIPEQADASIDTILVPSFGRLSLLIAD